MAKVPLVGQGLLIRVFTITLKSPDHRPFPDNTQHSEGLISMTQAGFETAISASDPRPVP